MLFVQMKVSQNPKIEIFTGLTHQLIEGMAIAGYARMQLFIIIIYEENLGSHTIDLKMPKRSL